MITVHYTDAEGMYAGQTDIPDRFPGQGLPARTYTEGPPDTPLPSAWHRWHRNDDAWVAVEDHRGRDGWLADGTPHLVTALGPLPDGWSQEPPQPTEDEVFAAEIAAVEAEYAAKVAALVVRKNTAELLDGALQESRIAAIRADYQAAKAARQSALDALMEV